MRCTGCVLIYLNRIWVLALEVVVVVAQILRVAPAGVQVRGHVTIGPLRATEDDSYDRAGLGSGCRRSE